MTKDTLIFTQNLIQLRDVQEKKISLANLLKSLYLGSHVTVIYLFIATNSWQAFLILMDTGYKNLICVSQSSSCCTQGALLHFILADTHKLLFLLLQKSAAFFIRVPLGMFTVFFSLGCSL